MIYFTPINSNPWL